MKIATLFSGIGAPEQGAMRVYDEVEHIFACEIDKFARISYKAMYGIADEHFHSDICELDGTQYQGKVDVLVGGSPCQSFSIAGLRKGTSEHRGQLIYEYIRVVDEVKAPIIIYENVKGIMSIDGGRTIKDFVQALRDIGYYCHYEVINTKDYGVPQNRERLFLVGFLDHEHYHRFQFAPKVKLEKRLRDILEDDVDEKYYLNKPFESYSQQSQGNTLLDINLVCNTLMAGTHGYCQGYINKGIIGMLDMKGNEQIRRVYGTDGTAPCLQTMQGGNRQPKIQVKSATAKGYETAELGDSINLSNPKSETRRGRVGKQVAQTLDCACNQAVFEERIRKLTPLECWRLQDFLDEAFCKAQNAGVSNSQLYKQAGNSMSVNVLEMIFSQIEATRYKSVGLF
ncbi:MAG: DNA (cytosine-5-)-methyltransferase [Candidatus Cloacimonetes bacterium]|nr:DNA (cytosine-5-)-methyltransferase [Candidatus Cloacimonadota bacterium]